jgi:uncharacterized membrane protein YidH (DUF202 family)
MDPLENPDEAAKQQKKKGKKELSLERVRLALERLQLAWLRTAITFIALGFTSFKFYYGRIEEGQHPVTEYVNGRTIGIFLILVGLVGLLQATLQHRKNHARLKVYYPQIYYSVSLVQSYAVMGLAAVLLWLAIFEI